MFRTGSPKTLLLQTQTCQIGIWRNSPPPRPALDYNLLITWNCETPGWSIKSLTLKETKFNTPLIFPRSVTQFTFLTDQCGVNMTRKESIFFFSFLQELRRRRTDVSIELRRVRNFNSRNLRFFIEILCWAPWISQASPYGQRKLSVIPRCLQSEFPLYNCCSLI